MRIYYNLIKKFILSPKYKKKFELASNGFLSLSECTLKHHKTNITLFYLKDITLRLIVNSGSW